MEVAQFSDAGGNESAMQSSSICLSSCEGATPPDIKAKQDLDHPRIMDSVDPGYSACRWDRGNYPYYKAPVPANTSSSSYSYSSTSSSSSSSTSSSSSSSGVLAQYTEIPHVLPTSGNYVYYKAPVPANTSFSSSLSSSSSSSSSSSGVLAQYMPAEILHVLPTSGDYLYYKAPVPANTSSTSSSSSSSSTSSSTSSSGVLAQYMPAETPPHVLPTRGDLYRECLGFCVQPEHGICGRRTRRHRPPPQHSSPDIVHWGSAPVGCPCCCGQHVMHRHAGIHAGHVHDSFRIYAAPVGNVTPDDFLEYGRETIDERQGDAPVRCLPDSPEAVGSTQEPASCRNNNSPSNMNTRSDLILLSEATQPKNREETVTIRCLRSDLVGLRCEDQSNSMTNVDISESAEEAKELPPANKANNALLMSQPERNSGLKAASRTYAVASQVTPLYGRPAWWGDDPEQENNGQWKHSPSAESTVYSTSSSTDVRLTAVCMESDDAVPSIESPSETAFKSLLNGNEANAKATNQRYSGALHQPRVHKASVIGEISLNRDDEESVSSSDPKYAGHCPLDTDFGNVWIQGPLRPDPPTGGDPVPIRPPPPPPSPTPTAFVVDLGQQKRGGGEGGVRQITVGTRLSEFLPSPLVRSLQRRLARMRRTHRDRRPAADRTESRTERNDSTFDDDVIVDDAAADDVSDAGTYTVDDGDGEAPGGDLGARTTDVCQVLSLPD